MIPAAITGFIVNPIWYVWLGVQLRGTEEELSGTGGIAARPPDFGSRRRAEYPV